MPKSAAEAERYSVDNCALEAKFMREGGGGGGGKAKAAVVDKDGQDDMSQKEWLDK